MTIEDFGLHSDGHFESRFARNRLYRFHVPGKMRLEMLVETQIENLDGQSSYDHLLHLLSNEPLNFERSLACLVK